MGESIFITSVSEFLIKLFSKTEPIKRLAPETLITSEARFFGQAFCGVAGKRLAPRARFELAYP
ncbi:MAG: hypothetical protein ABIG20_03985 [archaeon]